MVIIFTHDVSRYIHTYVCLSIRPSTKQKQDTTLRSGPGGSLEIWQTWCLFNYSHTIAAPPLLVVRPSDVKLSEGFPARMDCVAAGNPLPIQFWMKEGGTGILLPGDQHNDEINVSHEGTLKIG